MTAPLNCPTMYRSAREKVHRPAKRVDMVMKGLRCPPEAGADERIKIALMIQFDKLPTREMESTLDSTFVKNSDIKPRRNTSIDVAAH